MNRIPEEIVRFIKTFLTVDERFYLPKHFSKHLEQKLFYCWMDWRGSIKNKLVKFPLYYEKINLNMKTKLKWKNYNKNHSCYYHNNLKKPFPYVVIMMIQDIESNRRLSTITIRPKWNKEFTDDELFRIDGYFFTAFPNIPANPNKVFIDLFFDFFATPSVAFSNIHMSKSFIFRKLDRIVYDMKEGLSK